jgi:hypothetical protein
VALVTVLGRDLEGGQDLGPQRLELVAHGQHRLERLGLGLPRQPGEEDLAGRIDRRIQVVERCGREPLLRNGTDGHGAQDNEHLFCCHHGCQYFLVCFLRGWPSCARLGFCEPSGW